MLEALDCLSRGRSFRSHLPRQLVARGGDGFVLSARIFEEGHGPVDLGMERSAMGWRLRVRGEKVESLREFAHFLPIQILHPESHELIRGPSQLRREYIDWGVFHVEHRFGQIWQRYHRVLRQRNRALRDGLNDALIRAWDPELATLAEAIDQARRRYLCVLDTHLAAHATRLLSPARATDLSLDLRAGWNQDTELMAELGKVLPRDRDRGFTSLGPHRANIVIRYGDGPAAETASRGEQKLLVAALRLAQLACLRELRGRCGTFLVDDVSAELDPQNLLRLLEGITELGAQVFLTATTHLELPAACAKDSRVFHVKHGQLSEML